MFIAEVSGSSFGPGLEHAIFWGNYTEGSFGSNRRDFRQQDSLLSTGITHPISASTIFGLYEVAVSDQKQPGS